MTVPGGGNAIDSERHAVLRHDAALNGKPTRITRYACEEACETKGLIILRAERHDKPEPPTCFASACSSARGASAADDDLLYISCESSRDPHSYT